MKIVVLDGYTLNPGDLSWDGLKSLGDCTIYERTPPEKVVARAQDAQIVLTNKAVLDRAAIERLPNLQYIGVIATGYNIVDVDAASEREIPVTNVPTYGTHSVAQMVFALLLELTQRVGHHAHTVREGRWSSSEDFCYWDYRLVELHGLTMGIVGFGRIGRAVSRIALGFGMKVLIYDIYIVRPEVADVEFVDLDTLFTRSDVVTLHCPLTPETDGLVDAERLAQMKPSAFLINTSRGAVVNERDLVEALEAGGIAGAGLDVLAAEPAERDSPLLSAPNCLVTPHIAWATRAARARLMKAVVQNVSAFLRGSPQNVVNSFAI